MRTIRLSKGYTCNLGNYESARVEVTIEQEIHDGAKGDAEIDEIWNKIDDELDAQIDELSPALDPRSNFNDFTETQKLFNSKEGK